MEQMESKQREIAKLSMRLHDEDLLPTGSLIGCPKAILSAIFFVKTFWSELSRRDT